MGKRKNKHLGPLLAEQMQIELTVQEMTFITEMVKHGNVARASTAAGWHPDTGYRKRDDERIQLLLNEARRQAFERSVLDIEWIMEEAEDLYMMAKQEGDIKAGISALSMIGKLSSVDAFAAQKVDVSTSDKIDRLRKARLRSADRASEDAAEDEVSFF